MNDAEILLILVRKLGIGRDQIEVVPPTPQEIIAEIIAEEFSLEFDREIEE